MRPLLYGLLLAASLVPLAPAGVAGAQWYPPGPPGYGSPAASGPMLAAGAPAADPAAACQRAVANAAYTIGNQMLQFTAAANLYPLTPQLRPVLAPPALYPGFGAIFAPGPSLGLANGVLAASVGGLAAFPPGAAPAAILNQLAASPTGLVAPGGIGTAESADLLTIAGLQQAQLGNILAAIDTRQGVLGTRLAAADLNAALTAWPREQAALLKEVLEGLTFYRDLVCGGSSSGNGEPEAAGRNGNGHRNGNGEANERP